MSLSDVFILLFSKDGLYGSIGTLVLAGTSFLAVRAAREIGRLFNERSIRKANELRMFVDLVLSVENCKAFNDPDLLESLKQRIRSYPKDGKEFRGYIAQVTDTAAYDEFGKFVHKYPPEIIFAYRKFRLADTLAIKQYEQLASKAFVSLDTDRKLDAVADCFAAIKEAGKTGDSLLYALAYRDPTFSCDFWKISATTGSNDGANWAKHGLSPQPRRYNGDLERSVNAFSCLTI